MIDRVLKEDAYVVLTKILDLKFLSKVLKILSEELNVRGNVYDSIEVYMKQKNHHLKVIKKVYEIKFNDYRDIDEEEMSNYINKKLGEFPIYKKITKTQFK